MSAPKLLRNTFEFSYKPVLACILLAVLSALSLIVPVIGYAACVFASAFILAQHKRHSIIESLFLSVLLFFAATIIIYSFTTLLGLHLPVRYASGLLTAAFIPYFIYQSTHTVRASVSLQFLYDGDVPAIVASIAVCITLLIPVFHMSGAKIAQFLSYGEDNASHYALSKYVYEHGSFAYKMNPQNDGLLKSLEIYPQGFHVNAATFIGSYPKHHITSITFVRLYMLFITLNYSVFVFWFVKLCMRTMGVAKSSPVVKLALLAPATFLCGLGPFLLLLDRGFQPQIFSYSFIAAIIFTLDNAKIRRIKDIQPALLALVLAVGIAASWWLLLPIPAVLLCQYIWSNKLMHPPVRKYTNLLPAIIVVGFAIAYPVFVNILLTKKSDPLNEPGGVDPIHGFVFWYLCPVVLLALPRIVRSIKRFSYTYVSLFISLGLLGLIGVYQMSTIGRLEYYFYKSIYTILLVSLVIFFLSAREILEYLYRALGKLKSIVPIASLGLFFIIAGQTNLVNVKVYIHNWFPSAVQPNDLNILFTPQATTYNHVVFLGSCNVGRNYLADRWSGARLESESPHFSALERATIKQQPAEMAKQLQALADTDKKLLIVQFPGCTDEISNLHKIEAMPNVTTMPQL